ncbi:MAG: hypothetical protein IAX22_08835 [Candidatus Bathyarchaeota archaeon]|nr:hypothetical protein [Candidatus Bathyarchaeota archaeon]
MKLQIEEKDESQTYRPVSVQQFLEMVRIDGDKVLIFVPNLCGGETRITVFESAIPLGNQNNFVRLKKRGWGFWR